MDKHTLSNELKVHAEYLRQTPFVTPLKEVEAINHILKCAASLENVAKELSEDEANNEQE